MAQTLADLLEALADPDDATREEAAQALAAQPDMKATGALIEALEDEYWAIRMYASHALAKIGGERVMEALVPLLGDPIKECRDAAVEGFVTMGGPAAESRATGVRAGGRGPRDSAPSATGWFGDAPALQGVTA